MEDRKEYLSSVLETLVSHHDPCRDFTAAWAAILVRQELGPIENHGYTRFKQVLEDLRDDGRLSFSTTEKGALCISLNTSPARPPDQPRHPKVNGGAPRRLLPHVWRAFVHTQSPGRRFLNSETGEVLDGLTKALPGDGWKEVEVVDVKADQDLAERLVEEWGLDIEVDREQWPLGFSRSLAASHPEHYRIWNRSRTQMVLEHVESWAEENGIGADVLFARANGRADKGSLMQLKNPAGQRELILGALHRMSDSELLEINIPAKYLLEAIAD